MTFSVKSLSLKAHDKALEVEFGGDTHIHRDVERIEVGDEWASACTAARSISHRVKDEVEQATGLKVARVVVSVDDVIA